MQLSYDLIQNLCEKQGWHWANDYAEPGYSCNGDITPAVVLGDYWLRGAAKVKFQNRTGNDSLRSIQDVYPRLFQQLSDQGVEFEWCDEWTDIDGLAYRTTHDSYQWQPSFWCWEGDLCTLESDGIESLTDCHKNDPHTAINLYGLNSAMLEAEGWFQVNGRFENGWFPGQNDDPVKITEHYRKEFPDHDFVFVIGGVGQFDIAFNLFARPLDNGE